MENKFPRTLFEPGKVAGSATCKQSKKVVQNIFVIYHQFVDLVAKTSLFVYFVYFVSLNVFPKTTHRPFNCPQFTQLTSSDSHPQREEGMERPERELVTSKSRRMTDNQTTLSHIVGYWPALVSPVNQSNSFSRLVSSGRDLPEPASTSHTAGSSDTHSLSMVLTCVCVNEPSTYISVDSSLWQLYSYRWNKSRHS